MLLTVQHFTVSTTTAAKSASFSQDRHQLKVPLFLDIHTAFIAPLALRIGPTVQLLPNAAVKSRDLTKTQFNTASSLHGFNSSLLA